MWHNIFPNNPPKYARYLTYAFIALASVWLTITVYLYFSGEIMKGIAALISCTTCTLLSSLSCMWDSHLRKKALKESVINKVTEEFYPTAKALLTKFQSLSQNKTLVNTTSMVMLLLTAASLVSNLKKYVKK